MPFVIYHPHGSGLISILGTRQFKSCAPTAVVALSFVVILRFSGPRISNGGPGPEQCFAKRLDLDPLIVNL
jgi:hypothetical protein